MNPLSAPFTSVVTQQPNTLSIGSESGKFDFPMHQSPYHSSLTLVMMNSALLMAQSEGVRVESHELITFILAPDKMCGAHQNFDDFRLSV